MPESADPTSVYLYYDRREILIYVGITGRGEYRQVQHNKTAEWWPYVARQDVKHVGTRLEALAVERYLIEERRPPFNRQHNSQWKDLRAAYVRLFPAPQMPSDGSLDSSDRHACLAKCEDLDECDWLECGFPNATCDDPECTVCHAQWHGEVAGISLGMAIGEGRYAMHFLRFLDEEAEGEDDGVKDMAWSILTTARALERELRETGRTDQANMVREHLIPPPRAVRDPFAEALSKAT